MASSNRMVSSQLLTVRWRGVIWKGQATLAGVLHPSTGPSTSSGEPQDG